MFVVLSWVAKFRSLTLIQILIGWSALSSVLCAMDKQRNAVTLYGDGSQMKHHRLYLGRQTSKICSSPL